MRGRSDTSRLLAFVLVCCVALPQGLLTNALSRQCFFFGGGSSVFFFFFLFLFSLSLSLYLFLLISLSFFCALHSCQRRRVARPSGIQLEPTSED